MNHEYATIYRELYTRHWWWRAREATILKTIQKHCEPDNQQRVLDIGCGDGLLFPKLQAYGKVDGVEADYQLISPDNPWRDRIHVGPFEGFHASSRYNLVLMLDVLEHFADPASALAKTWHLMADNGILLVHVPAFQALWTSHDDLNHHYTRFTKRTLQALLEKANFTVVRMEYAFQWTCPIKLAIRLKESLAGANSSLPRTPNHLVNQLAYYACRLERRTLGRLPLPFGSSLMAVVVPDQQRASCEDGESGDGSVQQSQDLEPVAAH